MLFLAYNRHLATVCVLSFLYWEECQNAFRFGIVMPDGNLATGIGRAKCALDELEAKVRSSSMRLLA